MESAYGLINSGEFAPCKSVSEINDPERRSEDPDRGRLDARCEFGVAKDIIRGGRWGRRRVIWRRCYKRLVGCQGRIKECWNRTKEIIVGMDAEALDPFENEPELTDVNGSVETNWTLSKDQLSG